MRKLVFTSLCQARGAGYILCWENPWQILRQPQYMKPKKDYLFRVSFDKAPLEPWRV